MPRYIVIPEMVLKVLQDLWSRSDESGNSIREYKRRYNYRIIIVTEGILEVNSTHN